MYVRDNAAVVVATVGVEVLQENYQQVPLGFQALLMLAIGVRAAK